MNNYEGDSTTEQRFLDYLTKKRLQSPVEISEHAKKRHALEFEIFFTPGDKTNEIAEWRRIRALEKAEAENVDPFKD